MMYQRANEEEGVSQLANVMPFGLYLLRGVVIFVVTELDDMKKGGRVIRLVHIFCQCQGLIQSSLCLWSLQSTK